MAQNSAAVPDPLNGIHICLTLMGFGNNTNYFIQVYSITGMDDFMYMDTGKSDKIIKL